VVKGNVKRKKKTIANSENDFRTYRVIKHKSCIKRDSLLCIKRIGKQVEYIGIETIKPTDFENKKLPLRENTTT